MALAEISLIFTWFESHGGSYWHVWRVGFEESAVKGLELTFCAVCRPKARLPHRSNDPSSWTPKITGWKLNCSFRSHYFQLITFILEKPMIPWNVPSLVRCFQPLLGDCWGHGYEKWALWLAWPLGRFACWNGLSMVKQWSILISQNIVRL